jgi:hypothetical protein
MPDVLNLEVVNRNLFLCLAFAPDDRVSDFLLPVLKPAPLYPSAR